MPLTTEVKGLLAAQRKLEQVTRDLQGEDMTRAFRESAMLVTRDAKILAPVDRGHLKASITPAVRQRDNVIEGVVGSNVAYAPYQETGTRPHWPPLAALETWARRHGTSAYVVARAIARRGTKGRRYLQGAFEKNRSAIQKRIGRAVNGIVKK
ncbi:MAG TPA: HK97 gp10 family phage protein [Aggregatilinea sp.]|uniref:HK97 gp10 family phage protein n=1 Tax=Aggregatilinea sp. TaxID=2806333 RepID=UPI002BED3FEB|nr:HK97 gp10 family phage protein [Aggregatilinea sp.]HML23517.1 HK97 gp10 family phage protein [Aggregatilinea sp.]